MRKKFVNVPLDHVVPFINGIQWANNSSIELIGVSKSGRDTCEVIFNDNDADENKEIDYATYFIDTELDILIGKKNFDDAAYHRLLLEYAPLPVKTAEDYRRTVDYMNRLSVSSRPLTPEEEKLMELLKVLLAQGNYNPRKDNPTWTPADALRYLIGLWGVKQKDLADATNTGSKSYVSEMTSGKKTISIDNAKALAAYFKVSVETFL